MSSSDPFRHLGIKRKGADATSVKRAYAKKLKVTRPEDDPTGFMELRQAMETALQHIRWAEEGVCDYDDDTNTDEDISETEPSPVPAKISTLASEPVSDLVNEPEVGDRTITPGPVTGAIWSDAEEETSEAVSPEDDAALYLSREEEHHAVDAAAANIAILMNTPDKSAVWSNWAAIIDSREFESLDAFHYLSQRIRQMICDETRPQDDSPNAHLSNRLPPQIILRLDERFGWSRQAGTNWYERDQNTWIGRLVDIADDLSSRNPNTPWGKQKLQTEVIGKSTHVEKKLGENTSAGLALIWMIARIAMIIGLIRFIGHLFDN